MCVKIQYSWIVKKLTSIMKLLFISLVLCTLVCSVINKPIFGNDEERKIYTTVVKSNRDSPRNVGEKKFNDLPGDGSTGNDHRPNEWDPTEERPNEVRPNEEKPNEEKPNEEKPNEKKPNEEKPNEEKPNEESPNGEKPNEEKPNEEKPNEEKPNEEKPNEERPPSIKPVVPKIIGNIIYSSINHFW